MRSRSKGGSVELREMEIFLTLAEELHFGRTAARLRVTPSRVSQAIRRQERAIGAALFERTSRSVRLTLVGQRLRERLRPAYDALNDAIAVTSGEARAAAETMTIGAMGAQAHEMATIVERFRSRHPYAEIGFREIYFADPFTLLREGKVDLAVTWLPVAEPDLEVGVRLRGEPQHLMVAEHHPLAAKGPVSLEVLADHPSPRVKGPAPRYWLDAVLPLHTPAGRPVRPGPEVATFEEVLALVLFGDLVCPVPDEARRYHPRPGVVYLPLTDAPPVEWGIVSRTGRTGRLARAFMAEAEG